VEVTPEEAERMFIFRWSECTAEANQRVASTKSKSLVAKDLKSPYGESLREEP
jgi:hypothetical protein